MTLLIAISLAFAVLAFFFLFRSVYSLRRRRVLRACGSSLSCLMCAAIAGAGAMLLLSYLTYTRLIDEQLISRIEFEEVASDVYQARLMITDEADRFFRLRGDEWQMDARIVTWKPPLTVLGLDPVYQLDRLSGRFAEIDREQTELRTVHSLTLEAPADLWRFTRRFPQLMPGVDAHYGTATFVPMSDGARYEVSLSRDALIARPANDAARDAVGAWRAH